MANKGLSKREVHKIVDDKLSMHIKYPAPKGHKGLEKLMKGHPGRVEKLRGKS